MKKFCLAVTGASGVVYGVRTAEMMLAVGAELHLIVSEAAEQVMRHELAGYHDGYIREHFSEALAQGRLYQYDNRDIAAPLASGSFLLDGMLIVPCSMDMMAAVAHGLSGTLIARAAGVALKENRMLLLAPREMPLSGIHLQNMLTLSQQRVLIAPAMPGFYTRPATLQDIIDFVVGKILDMSGIDHQLWPRYTGE
jgi:4-hydroxy-3-polyprenylbenzoate decarboxylase